MAIDFEAARKRAKELDAADQEQRRREQERLRANEQAAMERHGYGSGAMEQLVNDLAEQRRSGGTVDFAAAGQRRGNGSGLRTLTEELSGGSASPYRTARDGSGLAGVAEDLMRRENAMRQARRNKAARISGALRGDRLPAAVTERRRALESRYQSGRLPGGSDGAEPLTIGSFGGVQGYRNLENAARGAAELEQRRTEQRDAVRQTRKLERLRQELDGQERARRLALEAEAPDATLKNLTLDSLMRGYDTTRFGEEAYKELAGLPNHMDEYARKLAGEPYPFVPKGILQKGVSGAAELLGQQVRQWTKPETLAYGAAAAGSAFAAGQMGPQALAPEEIVTVPGALAAGIAMGSAKTNFEVEAGLAYNEMLENGISEQTARLIALGVGGINAALESVQASDLMKGLKVTAGKAGTQSVARGLLQELERRGIAVGNETLQEIAQEAATIAGAQAASRYETGEWAYTAEETAERLKDTAVGSALSFGVMNAPGAARNTLAVVRNRPGAQAGTAAQGSGTGARSGTAAQGSGTGAQAGTLGENGRKNYSAMRERDGGKTPDFDAQYRHYYDMARSGLEDARIPQAATTTPVSGFIAQAAKFAGRNDGLAEAQGTVRRLLDGETVGNAEIDRALSFPESRKRIEQELTGPLPENGFAAARDSVREAARLRMETEAARKAPVQTEQRQPPIRRFQEIAESLLSDYESTADAAEISEDLQKLYSDLNSSGEASLSSNLLQTSTAIARKIMRQSAAGGSDPNAFSQQYADMKKYLQNNAITLSQADRESMQEGYESFRKRNFGRLRLVNKGGLPIDSMYQQLQSDYGEGLFPAGITHPADQLEQLGRVLDGFQSEAEGPNMSKAAVHDAAMDLLDRCLQYQPEVQAPKADAQKAVRSANAEMKSERIETGRNDTGHAPAQESADGGRIGLIETEISRAMKAEDREYIHTMLEAVGLRGAIVSQTSDTANAQIENGVVRVYANADDAAGAYRGTVRHEVTHQIRALGAEHYQAFEDFAVQARAARDGVSVESLLESTRETYRTLAGQELTDAQAREEIAGDFAMLLDVDGETVRQFVQQSEPNRRTARGILQTIRDIIRRVRERFANRRLSREQRDFLRQMERGERLWAEALGEASLLARNENAARTDGGTRFSIKRAADGSQFVEVDTDILEGVEERDIPRVLSDIIRNDFHNLITVHGQKIGVNQKTAKEWRRSREAQRLYNTDRAVYDDKIRAFNHADELLEASRNYIGEAARHRNYAEFARGEVDFRVSRNGYTADVIVGISESGRAYLYDIVNISRKNIADASYDQRRETPAGSNAPAMDTSITDSETDVNENLPTRFSLKKPVEETRNLIAVHNLTGAKLQEALRLGGLPVPSIAVIKAAEGHANYGDISIVFGKDSIDPQANKANHIYGGDAWTPTAPQVHYEADPAVEARISERLNGLSAGTDEFFRNDLHGVSYDLDDLLNQWNGEEGAVRHVLDNYGLKAAFLEEQGQHIAAVKTQKEARKGYDPGRAEKYRAILDILGTTDAEEIGRMPLKELREQHGAALEQAFPGMTKTAVRMRSILRQTQAYMNRDTAAPAYETVTDGAATRRAVDAALDRPVYERWVRELFAGLEGKRGIYNGKDPFTPSGRRRSFDQLHYAYTLENLVKVMSREQARGVGVWGASAKALQSVTAPEYRSIQAMKDDSGRLGKVSDAWYESVLEEMDGVLDSVLAKIQRDNPGGYSMDGIAEVVLDAARGKKTVDAIVKEFRKNGLKLNNAEAMRLQGLFKASAELPTGYFEAKPQRAVSLKEALAAILPNDADPALRQALDETGVQVLIYEAEDEQSRLEALNSLEDARFSLKNSDAAITRLAQYRERYGTIPRGEQAIRDIMFPKQIDEQTRVRRFARTAAESASLTDEQAGAIGEAVAEGRFSYEPIGDRAARNYAEEMLGRGTDAAADAWARVVNRDGRASKNDIALGEYLLKEAAKAGDTERVVQLAAEIAAEGTRAGQVVQAMRLLKRLDGAGQLVALDATLKKLQGELDRGKSGVFLKVSDELRQELAGAKGEAETNAALDRIYTELAGQLPSSWADKWNAWRYLSMLGNPRTHIRNILGNAAFEPAILVKNIIGAALERAFVPVGERTKSLSGLLPGTGGKARQFAQADFKEMKDIITGGGKMNPTDMIRERQRVFKTGALEWIRKQNFNFLEAEDGIFLEHHYVRAMTQYLKANKVDVDTLDPNSREGARLLNRARDYAVREAQKATYRDFSLTAQTISQASNRAGKLGQIVIEGVLPFKKTPVNVLKRGVEYSPIGLANAVTRGAARVISGKSSASEFIDGLSAGLTGTGIAALGWLLASTGVLSGGGDDDKEQEFRDALGAQSWALRFGDKTYTIDWLAPSAMPLFVGAEALRLCENGMELNGRSVWDAAMTIAEPLTQMSMLDGLNAMLTSVRYGENPLSDLLTGAAADYVSQAVPTLLGQIARTVDPVRRTAYDDKNSGVPSVVQKTMQKNANKIPFLSRHSAAYLDLWGREQFGGSLAQRALQNFISPGYVKDEALSAMETELIRLYQATGDGAALPGKAAKSFTVGKGDEARTKYLTADEYQAFAETRGALLYGGLSEMTASPYYQTLADEDRADAVGKMTELASAVAKTGVSEYVPDGWHAKAVAAREDCGIPFSTFVLAYSAQAGVKGLKDRDGEGISNSASLLKMEAIYSVPGLNDRQRAYLFEACGVGEKVRHYNKAKVKQELDKMKQNAGWRREKQG